MKAVVQRAYGDPEQVLGLAEVEPPSAGADDVLIRVKATSVNTPDWIAVAGVPYILRLQSGLRRPSNPVRGSDVAGVVEEVGSDVTGLRPGDEVFGSIWENRRAPGAFAELTVAPEAQLIVKPADLSFADAGAAVMSGLTALAAMRDVGRVGPESRVLINGASGGVGTFAVQIAKTLGAEVTGVCSTRNIELVRSLGADHVIDYTKDDDLGGPYDVVFQVSGMRSPSDCRRLLTRTGTLVFISGDATGHVIGPIARMLAAAVQSPFVSQRLANYTVKPTAEDLRALTELIEAGRVTPVIDRTYALAEAPAAVAYVDEGHARGKVVITVEP
jgi:NADPH:quinone reductase-like Zn-dependent oxidoreductase